MFFLGGGGFHGIYFHSVLADIAKEFSKVFVPPYIPHKSPREVPALHTSPTIGIVRLLEPFW